MNTTILLLSILSVFLFQNDTKPIRPSKNSNLPINSAYFEKIRLNHIDPTDLQVLLKIINQNQFQRFKNGK